MQTAAICRVLKQGAAACRDCTAATAPELPAPNKSRVTTAAPCPTQPCQGCSLRGRAVGKTNKQKKSHCDPFNSLSTLENKKSSPAHCV